MKTFLFVVLTFFVLTSFGQQPENTQDSIQEAQMALAQQLLGLHYSGTIDDLTQLTRTHNMDMNIVHNDIYNTFDSLNALGKVGYMDPAIYTAAKHLDTSSWAVSQLVPMLLFDNKQYNEAAFLMYVSFFRYHYLSNLGATPIGGDRLGGYYRAKASLYIHTDVNNYLNVINAAINYCENNDYPSHLRSENMEQYDEALTVFNPEIEKVKANKEESQAYYDMIKLEYEVAINEEAARDASTKNVIVKNGSLIGEWTGSTEYENELVIYNFYTNDSVCMTQMYQIENNTCVIDYDKSPIRVKIFYTNLRTNEKYAREYIAEFMAEDKIRFGAAYDNNANKINPNNYFILTRKTAGAKHYYDYPKVERSDTPEQAKRITEKELKQFWSDNIQTIIGGDIDQIMMQIRFPFSGINDGMPGDEINATKFKSQGRYDSPILYSGEFKAGIKDLDYTHIQQVELDNGEVMLMIYMLGNLQYKTWAVNTPAYRQFGLLFKKVGTHWKLCYYNIGNFIDGSPKEILEQQNFMIENWLAKFPKQPEVVPPPSTPQPEKVVISIEETQMAVALQMMGLEYNGTINDLFNQTGPGALDMNLIYSNIYRTSDSLKAIGDIGHMDQTVFTTAQYLDTCNWIVSPIVSMLLFENKQYNEAAFLMYVSTMRFSYLTKIGVQPEGGQALSMVLGLYYLPNINIYLQTDYNNFINVLNMALDYCKNNDYPAYPRSENTETYEKVLLKSSENISQLEEKKEEYAEYWEKTRSYYVKQINDEAKIEAAKKEVIVENTSLIGKWTGTGNHNHDPVTYNFISIDSVYIESDSRKIKKTTYVIDYEKSPIIVKVLYTNFVNNETHTLEYIAEFLDENKLKFGKAYSNNPIKFNPEHSFIVTRKIAGEKSYYDYPKIERTDTPEKLKRVSNTELKKFWNDNIQAIIEGDPDKIIRQIRFPISGYNEGGTETDLSRFIDYGSYDSPFLNNEALAEGLKDLDYSCIQQVEMYNGDVLLMIYMLGRPQYIIPEDDTAKYREFGLLFKNDGEDWKLCYHNIGTIINGSPERILEGQNAMLEYWSAKYAKETIFSENIQSMIDFDKEKIVAQTNFPLRGNWGEIIGLSGDSSNWTADDLAASLDVFFSNEMRLALSKLYPQHMDETYDEPFTFNTYASPKATRKDGDWVYYDKIEVKFGYLNNEWKLIQLDFEKR